MTTPATTRMAFALSPRCARTNNMVATRSRSRGMMLDLIQPCRPVVPAAVASVAMVLMMSPSDGVGQVAQSRAPRHPLERRRNTPGTEQVLKHPSPGVHRRGRRQASARSDATRPQHLDEVWSHRRRGRGRDASRVAESHNFTTAYLECVGGCPTRVTGLGTAPRANHSPCGAVFVTAQTHTRAALRVVLPGRSDSSFSEGNTSFDRELSVRDSPRTATVSVRGEPSSTFRADGSPC